MQLARTYGLGGVGLWTAAGIGMGTNDDEHIWSLFAEWATKFYGQ
jgi:hypothetical protein